MSSRYPILFVLVSSATPAVPRHFSSFVTEHALLHNIIHVTPRWHPYCLQAAKDILSSVSHTCHTPRNIQTWHTIFPSSANTCIWRPSEWIIDWSDWLTDSIHLSSLAWLRDWPDAGLTAGWWIHVTDTFAIKIHRPIDAKRDEEITKNVTGTIQRWLLGTGRAPETSRGRHWVVGQRLIDEGAKFVISILAWRCLLHFPLALFDRLTAVYKSTLSLQAATCLKLFAVLYYGFLVPSSKCLRLSPRTSFSTPLPPFSTIL